jgi:ferredoxin
VEKLKRYLHEAAKKYDIALNHFLYHDYLRFTDFLDPVIIGNGLRLHIFRYDAFRGESHSYDSYNLQYQPNDQLLDLLEKIKTELDHTLSYRRSCRHGICGSCAMKVNGKPVLACSTPVRDLVGEFGRQLRVDPLDRSRVIRDLICDMDDFWEKSPAALHTWSRLQRLRRHLPARRRLEARRLSPGFSSAEAPMPSTMPITASCAGHVIPPVRHPPSAGFSRSGGHCQVLPLRKGCTGRSPGAAYFRREGRRRCVGMHQIPEVHRSVSEADRPLRKDEPSPSGGPAKRQQPRGSPSPSHKRI